MGMIESEIVQLGDDTLKSQFEVVFPTGIPGGGDSLSISLRMDETFDPPEHGVQIYEVFRKGQKIPKAGGAEEVDKMFTVNVRLDQKWKVYDDLFKWKRNYVYNDVSGTPGKADGMSTTVDVISLDRDDLPVKRIHFTGVFLAKIKIQDFDNQSPDPTKLELTFHFVRMEVV